MYIFSRSWSLPRIYYIDGDFRRLPFHKVNYLCGANTDPRTFRFHTRFNGLLSEICRPLCLNSQSIGGGGLCGGFLDKSVSFSEGLSHFAHLLFGFVSLRLGSIGLRFSSVSQSVSVHTPGVHFLPLLIKDKSLNHSGQKKTEGEKSHSFVSPLWPVGVGVLIYFIGGMGGWYNFCLLGTNRGSWTRLCVYGVC